MQEKILFVGGSGVVGSRTVRLLRDRHTNLPILVGGRNLEKAEAIADMERGQKGGTGALAFRNGRRVWLYGDESRLRGDSIGTELIIEIEGHISGKPQTIRSMIEFTRGQAILTGISVVLALSTVMGLEGQPPVSPGLYFPEHIIDSEWFLNELIHQGVTVTKNFTD